MVEIILQLVATALIGVTAGVCGGLAGIGGSMIILPGLVWLFGYPDGRLTLHHAYMASAMCVNVAVAVPAALRHHRAGAVRLDALRFLLPAMTASIVLGVLVSNVMQGDVLRKLLAGFIGAYCLLLISQLVRGTFGPNRIAGGESERAPEERTDVLRMVTVGLLVGFVAGLLGIGGGVVLVPLLQLFGRMRLRSAIATSSASMCLSSLVGAALKVSTLDAHNESIAYALTLALVLAPSAVIGAWLGAALAHRLSGRTVRVAIVALLLVASSRMAGLWGQPEGLAASGSGSNDRGSSPGPSGG